MAGGTASNLPSPRMRRSASCERRAAEEKGGMSQGWILILMAALFLGLGYIGVPVAFSLTAGVLLATMLTPISLPSIIGQLFNGIDSEALLAVPFFLLVGELMTSANVVGRMINLSLAMIGHMRGGLAQVVTLFSMFFSGISGSSSADVAVLSRTLAPSMAREGYDPGFTAALIEAGGRDWNPLIHIPAGFMKMLDHPTLTWGFRAEPDPGTNGRAILYPRGRVLGGS